MTCTPTKAQFTVFLGLNTPTEAVEYSKNSLLALIHDGMMSDRYTSNSVKQVSFVGDQDQLSYDNTKVVENEQSDIPAFAIIASVISSVVLVVGIILIKQRKGNRNIAPMNARRKSVVSFAQSLEEEIPCVDNSSHFSCSSRSSNDASTKRSECARERSKSCSEQGGDDSDMILQWAFKKDKFVASDI